MIQFTIRRSARFYVEPTTIHLKNNTIRMGGKNYKYETSYELKHRCTSAHMYRREDAHIYKIEQKKNTHLKAKVIEKR